VEFLNKKLLFFKKKIEIPGLIPAGPNSVSGPNSIKISVQLSQMAKILIPIRCINEKYFSTSIKER
jgi:hypothetical protein